MEKRYVLGADLGTTSVKVGPFDDQSAKVDHVALERYELLVDAVGGIAKALY